MESAFWGLVGAIVGALASIATAWIATRSANDLRRSVANEERLERARAFQRQTLLDLQEAIHDAMRTITKAHVADLKAKRGGAAWGQNLLGDELNEDLRLAQRRVAILLERVADDALRNQLKAVMKQANDVLFARTEDEARLRLESSANKAFAALEALGVELRKHYEP